MRNLLKRGMIVCFLMGVGLTYAAFNTYRGVSGDIPVVSSAADFGKYYAMQVYVDAPITFTDVSAVITTTERRPRGRSATRDTVWYLYVIQFDDAYVALRSRYNNLKLDSPLFVRVLHDDNISSQLTALYPAEFSAHSAIYAYRNLAFTTFFTALGFLLGGVGLAVANAKVKKRMELADVIMP